jgi:CO/xanthine dehydrogenase FAD-binding subunit
MVEVPMNKFEYLVPRSLDEAVSMYDAHGDQAAYIAGGTDVVVKMKEHKFAPGYLISLKQILTRDQPEINRETGELTLAASVTHRMIEKSAMIKLEYPILHDAVRNIGSVQIRNVATIGGNLVNAVPSADGAIPLIALDARVNIYGAKGERSLELVHFFTGPGQTVLTKGEILTEIVVPPPLPLTGSAYIKFGRRKAMELPMLGVGVLLSLEETSGHCTRARVCLGVAAPTPFRALGAERFLTGKDISEEALKEAGKIAAEESQVRDSIRGVAWYRREMVAVLVRRMGQKCIDRIEKRSQGPAQK